MNFFEHYRIEQVQSANLDEKIGLSDQIVCVFFWGKDCPNCEIAKKVLVGRKEEIQALQITWFHADVYEDFELATRFGLFGIPVFLFFKNGKKLGKISPFPGFEPFYEALVGLVRNAESGRL